VLEAGNGLFIPSGFWHSVRGVGEGVNASVSVVFWLVVVDVADRWVLGQLVVPINTGLKKKKKETSKLDTSNATIHLGKYHAHSWAGRSCLTGWSQCRRL
jgi:hypothetical protein